MAREVKSMLHQARPWRRDVVWWVVLIEGVLSLALGIYIVLQIESSGSRMIQLIGGYLLLTSMLMVVAALRDKVEPTLKSYDLLRGGIGFIVGLLVFIAPILNLFSPLVSLTILAIGLLLSGLIGLASIVATIKSVGMRWWPVLSNSLLVLLGILLFISSASTAVAVVKLIGWVATIFGVGLTIYAIMLYRTRQSSELPVGTPASQG